MGWNRGRSRLCRLKKAMRKFFLFTDEKHDVDADVENDNNNNNDNNNTNNDYALDRMIRSSKGEERRAESG